MSANDAKRLVSKALELVMSHVHRAAQGMQDPDLVVSRRPMGSRPDDEPPPFLSGRLGSVGDRLQRSQKLLKSRRGRRIREVLVRHLRDDLDIIDLAIQFRMTTQNVAAHIAEGLWVLALDRHHLLCQTTAVSEEASKSPTFRLALAQACAWIALIQGPKRTRAMEEGLRTWLTKRKANTRAFELATDTRNEYRTLLKLAQTQKESLPTFSAKKGWVPLAATAAALAAVVLLFGVQRHFEEQAFCAGIQERRTIELKDGTTVSLHGASCISVRFTSRERRIRLKEGEALFNVRKDHHRPFAVAAGNQKIIALGTSFHVYLAARTLEVTLLEGKVNVVPDSHPVSMAADPLQPFTLERGQRVIFDQQKSPVVDSPPVDKLISKHGMVDLTGMTLEQGINVMNGHSDIQLQAEGKHAAQTKVDGIFNIGDSRAFARAVARAHRLDIRQAGQVILLSEQPPSEKSSLPRYRGPAEKRAQRH